MDQSVQDVLWRQVWHSIDTNLTFVVIWQILSPSPNRYLGKLIQFRANENYKQFCSGVVNPSVFFTFLKKAKFSIPIFFAPFGGDFNEFGSILNYIPFEISHFSAPQTKIFSISRLKNDFSFIF